MKTTTGSKTVFGMGVLGIGAALSIATPTLAAPRGHEAREDRREVREDRRDVKEAHRDLKQERHELKHADTPHERWHERRDVKEARRDLKQERRSLHRDRTENRREHGVHPGNGVRPGGYFGTVTNVRTGHSFDISVGGSIFNVFTISALPRGLSRGDSVRVNGVRQNNNDIRSAHVSIVTNR